MTGLLSPRQGEHWRWPYPSMSFDKSKSGLAMAMKSSRFDTGFKLWLKKDLPPRGRRLPAELGGLIGAKLWRSKRKRKESLTLESNIKEKNGGSGISLNQLPGEGLDDASLPGRSGNIHIPRGSTNFPEDQSEPAAPGVGGGPNGCSSGTKTSAARSPLVHAPNAPDSQVENGCPEIPCPKKCGRGRS